MSSEKSKLGEIKELVLSKEVSYFYQEDKGKWAGGWLSASERLYPGVLVDGHFYSGVYQKKRFVPGFVMHGQFIPGLLAQDRFFPGLTIDKSFHPGILAMGLFIPGIVQGNTFVPGLSNSDGFLPGSFTTDGKFMPGRFVDGEFESVVLDGREFVPGNNERFTTREAHALTKEGYGLCKIRHFEPIGGIPIRGIVIGFIDRMLTVAPSGLITRHGVILGGRWGKVGRRPDIPVLDQEAVLRELGIEVDELGDLLPSSHSGYLEQWIEEKMHGIGLGSGMFGGLGGPSGSVSLEEALGMLSQGDCALMDRENQKLAEYWSDLLASYGGGIVSEGSSKWSWDKFGDSVGAGVKEGIVTGMAGGGVAGTMGVAGLGTAAGMFSGAVIGGVVGAWKGAAEYTINFLLDVLGIGGDDNSGSSSGGGTSTADDEYGRGSGGDFYIQPRHAPLVLSVPGETVFGIKGEQSGGHSIITLKQTDTGALIVLDFSQAAFIARNSSHKGVNLGLNPLTGTAIMVTPIPVDPKVAIGRAFHQMYENYVIHPLTETQAAKQKLQAG